MYGLLRNLRPNYRKIANSVSFKPGHSLPAKCCALSLSVRNVSSRSSGLLASKTNFGILTVTKRSLASFKDKFAASKTLQKLQMADRVPMRYDLIYRTDLEYYLMSGQFVFLLFTLTIFGSLILKYFEWLGVQVKNKENKLKKEVTPTVSQQIFEATREKLGIQKDEDDIVLVPKLEELTEGDPETLYVILLLTITFVISLIRMQRRIPIRLYTSKNGHSIAVYYSSVIPGRTRLREFVAGTLKSMENPKGFLWSHNIYKDGTGTHMLLMREYFRTQQDFFDLLESASEAPLEGEEEST